MTMGTESKVLEYEAGTGRGKLVEEQAHHSNGPNARELQGDCAQHGMAEERNGKRRRLQREGTGKKKNIWI